MGPDDLFRQLDACKCQATLMRTQSAPTKLLDHVDRWQKAYADDIAPSISATLVTRTPRTRRRWNPGRDQGQITGRIIFIVIAFIVGSRNDGSR
jgi:hypothetical protein